MFKVLLAIGAGVLGKAVYDDIKNDSKELEIKRRTQEATDKSKELIAEGMDKLKEMQANFAKTFTKNDSETTYTKEEVERIVADAVTKAIEEQMKNFYNRENKEIVEA